MVHDFKWSIIIRYYYQDSFNFVPLSAEYTSRTFRDFVTKFHIWDVVVPHGMHTGLSFTNTSDLLHKGRRGGLSNASQFVRSIIGLKPTHAGY